MAANDDPPKEPEPAAGDDEPDDDDEPSGPTDAEVLQALGDSLGELQGTAVLTKPQIDRLVENLAWEDGKFDYEVFLKSFCVRRRSLTLTTAETQRQRKLCS